MKMWPSTAKPPDKQTDRRKTLPIEEVLRNGFYQRRRGPSAGSGNSPRQSIPFCRWCSPRAAHGKVASPGGKQVGKSQAIIDGSYCARLSLNMFLFTIRNTSQTGWSSHNSGLLTALMHATTASPRQHPSLFPVRNHNGRADGLRSLQFV